MTVGRYDDNTWAVYDDTDGEVLAYGFFESQDAHGWIEADANEPVESVVNRRQYLGRLRAGRCVRHDAPASPAVTFDGGYCPLGCRVLNVFVWWARGLTRRERKEWLLERR